MKAEEFEQALRALAIRKATADAEAAEIYREKAEIEREGATVAVEFQRAIAAAQGIILPKGGTGEGLS